MHRGVWSAKVAAALEVGNEVLELLTSQTAQQFADTISGSLGALDKIHSQFT